MKSPHLLRAGPNVRKLKENLANVVTAEAISAIETEICANVSQLYELGRNHYRFAVRQNNRSWRQKITTRKVKLRMSSIAPVLSTPWKRRT